MFITIVLMSLALTQDVVYGNYYNKNASLHKYGPNVCAIEDLSSGYRERGWPLDGRQQTCGQNTIVRYECCEGFKSTYSRSGCTGVKSPKNVLETARELGAHEFVRLARQLKSLYDLLTGDGGPYTVFVPTDEAFAKMDVSTRSALESYETAVNILRYHVAPRRIITQNASADEMFYTLNDGLRLRFNKYSTKIETINCVTIIRKNRIAQNGVVHLINDVLNPNSYSNRNIVQLINQNRELTIFARMLEISRIHQSLKDTFQTFTALAPTDVALQRLPQNQLRRILNDETLSRAFVLKHVLPTPICLNAVTEEHYVRSLADKHYVKFNCDGMHSITAQGNCINNDVKFSSNGMLYATNFIVNTDEGKSVMQILQHLGLSEFAQIVNIAGHTHTLENSNSLTVFAPTNKAIRCMNPMELYRLRSDPSAARMFVEFHVAREIVTPESVYDGKIAESLARGRHLRIQCVQDNFGVEGRLLNFQTPLGYNGAVHAIDKVLLPPMVSVEDLIRKNDSFSLYVQAIDMLDASVSSTLEFCGTRNTYFVPTDYAFRKLGALELERMFNDPSYMRKVLSNHRAERILPSALIKERWQYDVQTKNEVVRITNKGNRLMVNNADIIEADIMTTNGLVHVVNDLIFPETGPSSWTK